MKALLSFQSDIIFVMLSLLIEIHSMKLPRVAESDCVPHSAGFRAIVPPGILVYN